MERLVTVEEMEEFGRIEVCKAEGFDIDDFDAVTIDWSKDLGNRIRIIYKVKDTLRELTNSEYLYILNYVFEDNEWALCRAYPDIYYSPKTSELDGVEIISKGIL